MPQMALQHILPGWRILNVHETFFFAIVEVTYGDFP